MERGPYKGREELYKAVRDLRKKGFGYTTIGRKLQMSVYTARNWSQDIKVDGKTAYKLGQTPIPLAKLKSKGSVRRRLLEERGNRCEECGNDTWQGKPIVLECHNHRDPANSKLLCPNCHALTDDWRRKPKHPSGGTQTQQA